MAVVALRTTHETKTGAARDCPGLFGGDTRNRDDSHTNGWNAPKCEYRARGKRQRETIREI
jgi:hypothetical protein